MAQIDSLTKYAKSFLLSLIMLTVTTGAVAQTFNDGVTPAGFAPGAPTGSYSLSGLENINLFNGHLNFTLPLAKIVGRGGAQSTITLPIQMRWTNWYFFQNTDGTYKNPIPTYNKDLVTGFNPGYGPGVLVMRGEDIVLSTCGTHEIQQSRTRLTFIAQDGTEFELRDTTYGGAPVTSGDCSHGPSFPSRGTTFETADGTAATFVSDSAVSEAGGALRSVSGSLKMRDGTIYRIDNGLVSWIQDRNGNKITYTYTNDRVTLIKDSLGRETTIEYRVTDAAPYGVCDRITFKGSGGGTRIVRVSYGALSDNFAAGFEVQTKNELFPSPVSDSVTALLNVDFDTDVVASVWLPDDGTTTRRYRFFYNSYGEVARAELPTGGAYEYDWESGPTLTCNGQFYRGEILRRVKERRVRDASTLEQRTTYSYTSPSCDQSVNTEVTVDHFDQWESDPQRLSREKHFFYGSAAPPPYKTDLFNEPAWRQGKEYQTDLLAADGSTLLRSAAQTWQQRAVVSWWSCNSGCSADTAPPNDPRIVETVTTLENGQVSKTTSIDPSTGAIGFDDYNNPTDVYEFDYGSGSPGSFLRRTHTDYVTDTNYTAGTGTHLRGLPLQTWVSSDAAGSTKVSYTSFEYDNYATDSNHAGLTTRSSVTGHNTTNYGTGFAYRGNVTKLTKFATASNQTSGVSTYAQYDILGNVVLTKDANSNTTTIGYADNFGAPDNSATNNSAPSQISGYSTFAFPTSVTNPMGWISYVQYEYFTGQTVNTQDVNGMISKTIYNDDLDRPTQTVIAIGTGSETQTSIAYHDSDHYIETTADLNMLNDNSLKSRTYYDGLGRTSEVRQYEASSNYKAIQTQYDAMGRPFKRSNPFRPTEIDGSHPILWTQTTFDSLGRATNVTTPDGAAVLTSYSGNATTVADQAGKLRRSITNALGQLVRLDEPNGSNQLGTVSSPNQATEYTYDRLGNLTHVDQGSQDRDFAYDSLSRLTSATNPESGTITYTYDPNGNLKTKRDAMNIKTAFDYDALNRVSNRCYRSIGSGSLGMTTCASNSETPESNTPDVAYTYDDTNVANSKGKLTKVNSSVSATEFTGYDILGRVTSHKQTTNNTDYTTSYTYNLAGGLLEETYPSTRVVKNVLNADGDLYLVESRKNSSSGYWHYADSFTYNAAGAVTSMQLGNGRWESTVFNSRLQPTEIKLGATNGAYDLLRLQYSYGDWNGSSIDATKNNGNIVRQIITVPNSPGNTDNLVATQKYYYDPLNRIDDSTEEVEVNGGSASQSWRQDFSYDRYGNKNFVEANTHFDGFDKLCSSNTELCSDLRKKLNPSFGSDNRFSSGQSYSYDADGNTTADANGQTYIYDGENKQVQAKNSGNYTIGNYYYDGYGRRVKKIAYNATGTEIETTIFVYDVAGKQVAEYSDVVANSTDAKVAYLTNDNLGSPRINTNASGTATARHDYHPFGEEIATGRTQAEYSGDTVRKQFTGYERDDETGLDFGKARYLNSSVGRYWTPDRFSNDTWVVTPQSWNLYAYVRNNPLAHTDGGGQKIEFLINGNTYTVVRSGDGYKLVGDGGSNAAVQASEDAINRLGNNGQFSGIVNRMARPDTEVSTFSVGYDVNSGPGLTHRVNGTNNTWSDVNLSPTSADEAFVSLATEVLVANQLITDKDSGPEKPQTTDAALNERGWTAYTTWKQTLYKLENDIRNAFNISPRPDLYIPTDYSAVQKRAEKFLEINRDNEGVGQPPNMRPHPNNLNGSSAGNVDEPQPYMPGPPPELKKRP